MATYRKLLKNRAGDTIIPVTDYDERGRFSRYMNSNQSIESLTATTIKMGAKDFDEKKCSYSSSTGLFTIQQAGIWQLNGYGRYSTDVDTYGLVGIIVNDTIVSGFSGTASANASTFRSGHGGVSTLIHLNVGDTIGLRITPSGAITNNSRTHGQLSGFCVFPD